MQSDIAKDIQLQLSRTTYFLYDVLNFPDVEDDFLHNFVGEYDPKIQRYGIRFVGDLWAGDVACITIYNTHKSLPKFRGECTFNYWVYRIASNVCKEIRREDEAQYRRQTPINVYELQSSANMHNTTPEYLFAQKEEAEKGEITRKVRHVLRNMDKKRSYVLWLHYAEEKSMKEIMEELNMPRGSVGNNLCIGRREFSSLWEKLYSRA